MGNIINPNLLRLNINISWKSNWISYLNNNYSFILSHDLLLFSYINWLLNRNFFFKFNWLLSFSHYKIFKFNGFIFIIFFFEDINIKKFVFQFLKKFKFNNTLKNLNNKYDLNKDKKIIINNNNLNINKVIDLVFIKKIINNNRNRFFLKNKEKLSLKFLKILKKICINISSFSFNYFKKYNLYRYEFIDFLNYELYIISIYKKYYIKILKLVYYYYYIYNLYLNFILINFKLLHKFYYNKFIKFNYFFIKNNYLIDFFNKIYIHNNFLKLFKIKAFRLRIYNYFIAYFMQKLSLTYKYIFISFGGNLKFLYLKNYIPYIFLLGSSNLLTSSLIANYAKTSLKQGDLIKQFYNKFLKKFNFKINYVNLLYWGFKIEGIGRFKKQGRAQKQWFAKGKAPLNTYTSDIDFNTFNIQLRNGICNIKIYIVRKKDFYYYY